ncbi:hypothetical protein ACKFRM_11710 [Corynebacterium sp. YSMAA1_1_D6]|uniref:hypothetical protein n=1 Tax=Corynebacterium sp. YSMAA1_1_D6 TaxID=3383589 RepID=UPI0038D061D3
MWPRARGCCPRAGRRWGVGHAWWTLVLWIGLGALLLAFDRSRSKAEVAAKA